MFDLGYSLLMAVKVIVLFTLVYIFIPAQIIRFDKEETFLDKVFISLIHSNIITILIVHCLAFLKLYETFSLLFCYLTTYTIYSWLMGKSPRAVAEALGMKLIINILDMSEGKSGLGGELSKHLKVWLRQIRLGVDKIISDASSNPFAGLFPVVVLVTAAVIRFNHSIIHAYYGASDSYVHLAWIKYLGTNQIYKDGIWPYGYHALLSALNKLFFIDPYFIVRFMGPLAGFFLVMSVYYFAIKNFKGPYVALIAVAIYGLITDDRFLSAVARQLSALPQEYATIFLLPGFHFLNQYIKSNSKKYLWLSAECLALTLMIHPYATVFISIGYFVMLLCYPKKIFDLKFLSKSFSLMSMAILIAFSPLFVGIAISKKFHFAIRDVQLPSDIPGHTLNVINISEKNPYLLLLLICSSLMLLYGMILMFREDREGSNRIYIFIAVVSIVFYLQYKLGSLGLHVLVHPYRIGMFIALLAVFNYAGVINIADFFIRQKTILRGLKQAGSIAIIVTIFIFTPIKMPKGDCYEYDEAVNAYLAIKNSYPLFSWTIVAPVEQYQQALGYGWHYELLEFAKKVSDAGGQDRDKEFSLPTDYVFIFTEKIPLGLQKLIERRDLLTKIPDPSGDATGFYYRNAANRKILQSYAYYWAEDYMKKNSNMVVYYESQYLKIYLIKQDGRNPVKLFS